MSTLLGFDFRKKILMIVDKSQKRLLHFSQLEKKMLDYVSQIVRMLNQGSSRDEIFWSIKRDYYWKNWNAEVRQELADLIAQADELNVFAKGVVPKSEVL